MISIVLVSHSENLAKGARELAMQMVQGADPSVRIAIAGGVDNPDDPIGTDPMRVLEAIESVYSDDGVLVLMDLGSALMSAEAAIEFLDPEQQEKIYLCEAPIVEGAIAAAVQATANGPIADVIAEARNALAAKAQQLAPLLRIPLPTSADFAPESATSDAESTDLPTEEAETPATEKIAITVPNRLGLHARPAAKVVGLLNQYTATVQVTKGDPPDAPPINAKSINQLTTLGARQGDKLIFYATGDDASLALAALQKLAKQNFGDDDSAPDKAADIAASDAKTDAPQSADENELVGIPASDGFAVGPALLLQPELPTIVERQIEDPEVEWQRLRVAIEATAAELAEIQRKSRDRLSEAEADIFQAHLLMLQDPALAQRAKALLDERQINAEAAWQRVIDAVAAEYRKQENAYTRERAADLLDIGRRVLHQLMGTTVTMPQIARPSILVARDIAPSDAAQLDPAVVLGLITEEGSATGHSAILARALGIPAVVSVAGALSALENGQIIGLFGQEGRLKTRLTPSEIAALEDQRAAWLAARLAARENGQQPAITTDGRRIEVAANIGGPMEVAAAMASGAEGVGLFRTELLFMGHDHAPSEDEQYAAYCAVAAEMADRPVIVRTLDVGGDKPIPYLGIGPEANPFLGWRGIRYCLDNPQIFKPQLRALLRAAAEHDIRIMFPMVSTIDEVRAAKALLKEAQVELRREGVPSAQSPQVGIMIEVPSAVLVAEQLAAEVDFFSIGTNDLTQYVMAADRGNAQVASLNNALQPALLRAIQRVVQAAHRANIWIGICGEMAGNPLTTPLLVGLGLDELSMSAPAIPRVKAQIRALSTKDAQAVANHCLSLASVGEVEAYLRAYSKEA